MTMTPAWELALVANFGSVAAWRANFDALLAQHQHAALCFMPASGALENRAGPAGDGAVPLLLAEGSIGNIDWEPVYAAYQAAVHHASEAFGTQRAAAATSTVLDVRRAGVFAQAPNMLPGASWRDPAHVGQWAHELPKDSAVLVYCVYGHEVGRSTALRLRAAGVNARFLEGGIDGWLAAGEPVVEKPRS
jgi:superoxide dismutase, Fe-Mn family